MRAGVVSALASWSQASWSRSVFTLVPEPEPEPEPGASRVVKNRTSSTRARLRGDDSIAELCRREGIAQSLYYSWSKEFLEAGRRRLAGDTARQATSPEVKDLRAESAALKEAVADLTLENRLLKKSMIADGGDEE